MKRAGVDFALPMNQVAGRILAHHVLGETVSLSSRIRMMKLAAGRLGGIIPSRQGSANAPAAPW